MATKTVFVCQSCGTPAPRWSGRCADCKTWGSITEETAVTTGGRKRLQPTKTIKLADIKVSPATHRLDTGIEEVNRVLGGGIVPGSLLLLAGEPGVGKSTLLLQIASRIESEKTVLYVSGEESPGQIKLRANRLALGSKRLELLASTDIDEIVGIVGSSKPDFVIIDSIQTMSTGQIGSAAGTVSQITASTHLLQQVAKNSHTAVLVVGHVTKEGNIAGPKILEHLVDVVLYLEGERFGSFKLLRGVKNRFGSIYEVGVFEMQEKGLVAVENPSATLLHERIVSPGSIVFTATEGTRALLVEVQALVNTSPFGYPKRTGAGFDVNRLNVLIAVLSQRAGLRLGDKDVYINVVGGLKLNEPAADLAVALAIASAATSKPLPERTVVFGEIGLSGEIRSVNNPDMRIKEAKKLKFNQALAPKNGSDFIEPVATLREAIDKALGK